MSKPLTYDQNLWRWKILISTFVGYAGYYLVRKVLTLCKVALHDTFGWKLDDIAHIWTACLIGYMIGQFLSSYLGRRFGPRLILLFGLGISILCNVVFGFSNSYALFVTFMFINGIVQGTGWPGVVGAVSEWIRPHERGTFYGIWSTSYMFGNIIVKTLGAFLLAVYGWRWSFWGCAAITVFVWLLLYFWQRNKPEDVGLPPIVEHEQEENLRAIRASQSETISFKEYITIGINPVILTMGVAYLCIKFLRYSLDSWLPTFLNLQGATFGDSGYLSTVFDIAGVAGAILSGYALDKFFKGNWARLCFFMGIGLFFSYLAVAYLSTTPLSLALWFGLVGFMLYGPDTILCGTACADVAGARNSVAVAGFVNGLASIGPIIQEEVIGRLMRGDVNQGIRNTNLLAIGMSILFIFLMLFMMWWLKITHAKNRENETLSN